MARVVLLTRTSCTLEGGLYLFCSYFGGFFFPPPSKPPSAEGTGVLFNALPAACWATPDAAAVAMAPTLGTNFGSEVVPCMAKGTLLKPPTPLTF